MVTSNTNTRPHDGSPARGPVHLTANIRWAMAYIWAIHPGLLIALVAVSLLQSLLPVLLAVVAREIVNTVAQVLEGQGTDSGSLLIWLLLGSGVTTATIVLGAAFSYVSERQRDEMGLKISADIAEHAARLDYFHFEDPEFQDLIHRAQFNTAQHLSGLATNSMWILTLIGQMVTLTALLTAIEPMIVLLVAPLSIPYLLFHWRFSRRRFEEQQSRAENTRKQSYYLAQITGYQTLAEVTAYGLAPLFRQKMIAIGEFFRDRNRRFQWTALLGKVVFALLSVAAVYAAFWLAIQRVLAGELTIGDVAIFGGAAAQLRLSLDGAITNAGLLRQLTLHISNLRAFFAVPPQAPAEGSRVPATRRGAVEFKDVTFTYPGANRPTVRNVSLEIFPGETVALVGENGSGKTTLVKLLVQLYQPDSGQITFDGFDLRHLSPDYIRSYVSLVMQNFGRYEATAAENIAYGDWRRLLQRPDVVRTVAAEAGVDAMIEQLPMGYDTVLGRSFGTHNLSGGQWQMIAIARAFAREASLIVLDEPTANLDPAAEHRLFERYKRMAKGRTTLLISHRFSTVGFADRILVLEAGAIVETGTHHELMARKGLYERLYSMHTRQTKQALN